MPRFMIAILLLLAPAFAGDKPSPGKAHPGPVWAKSWSDALTEGQALNLPIVVHRHGFF